MVLFSLRIHLALCFPLQPFYDNVYYPYPSDPPGTHSSAGIPSLLSSPQSQPSSGSLSRPAASTMSGPLTSSGVATSTGIPPPFKFRARRENVDWRRINAVDVDRVASEMDFHTLQEHITEVTFCNVEGERCQRCQSPVDPALTKLFRLAQLTVEYLLHSQDCLSISLQAAEERLQAEARDREQLCVQLQKKSQDAKTLKEELKQRKKIIASQQAMFNAGIGANYHKVCTATWWSVNVFISIFIVAATSPLKARLCTTIVSQFIDPGECNVFFSHI